MEQQLKITVESVTLLKIVKTTLNIFAGLNPVSVLDMLMISDPYILGDPEETPGRCVLVRVLKQVGVLG